MVTNYHDKPKNQTSTGLLFFFKSEPGIQKSVFCNGKYQVKN